MSWGLYIEQELQAGHTCACAGWELAWFSAPSYGKCHRGNPSWACACRPGGISYCTCRGPSRGRADSGTCFPPSVLRTRPQCLPKDPSKVYANEDSLFGTLHVLHLVVLLTFKLVLPEKLSGVHQHIAIGTVVGFGRQLMWFKMNSHVVLFVCDMVAEGAGELVVFCSGGISGNNIWQK